MKKLALSIQMLAALSVVWCGYGCKQVVQSNAPAPLKTTKVPTPTRTLIYKVTKDSKGKRVDLKMHVFEPTNHSPKQKTAAVAIFFGGAWVGGEPKLFFPHCAYFASRGIMAFAPDYRVKNRQGTTPYESVADGKSAIRYLRAHASELGIDPNRIATIGSSSGGHIAACATLVQGFDELSENRKISSIPNALILYNAVLDTSKEGSPHLHRPFGKRWETVSPQQHIHSGAPPTLIFQGDADLAVPYETAVTFDESMRKAGNRSELVIFPGAPHGFASDINSDWGNQTLSKSDDFLVSLGYLKKN